MQRNLIEMQSNIYSSFLSVEKDIELILKKIFFDNQPYNKQLLRLLVINTKDCLSNQTNQDYINKINNMNLSDLINEEYIKLSPKIKMPEHEKVKSYIIISFDNFIENANNPEFRDCTISFDIICHTDYWVMDNYQIRPIKIIGYIDGILNRTKLTGIGTLNYIGCNELILDENLSGYTLSYRAIHSSEDKTENLNV